MHIEIRYADHQDLFVELKNCIIEVKIDNKSSKMTNTYKVSYEDYIEFKEYL